MSETARPSPTGTLYITCPLSGLTSSLEIREGGDVKGSLSLIEPVPASIATSKTKTVLGGFTGNWRGDVLIACPSLGLEGVVHGGGNLQQQQQTLHPLSTERGSQVGIAGSSSALTSSGAAQSFGKSHATRSNESVIPSPPPIPLSCVDLNRLGPMRLPRLWSALYDALLYNDPTKAQGGKASHGPQIVMGANIEVKST